MNHFHHDPKRLTKSVTSMEQTHPMRCKHQYEVVAQAAGAALKQCVKFGDPEAE
jgi:hypothetical protein